MLLVGLLFNFCHISIRGIYHFSSEDQFITSMAILPSVLVLPYLFLFFSRFSYAIDTITQIDPLLDGETLVSENGIFELGFFSPGSSKNRYVGIWYHKIPGRTVVWVANRDKPIKDNSGILSINTTGHLVLLSHNETVVWSANSTRKALSPIVQLLGSGNLVLKDEKDQNSHNYLWQSFDYPSDTLLPGMKLGWDLRTGLNRRLIAWKNWDDPSSGDFTSEIVLHNFPELVYRQGPVEYLRFGPWNGVRFSGIPKKWDNQLYVAKFVSNKDEVYAILYNLQNESLIVRVVLNQTSFSTRDIIWIEDGKRWSTFNYGPVDDCDRYNRCGLNANCMVDHAPMCQCLIGFLPKSPRNWNAMDWSEGCVHNDSWSCKAKNRDNFVKFSRLKFPDATYSWVNPTMTLEECKAKCWENCSCTAYANSDIRGEGSGCVMWFNDLIDIRQIPFDDQVIYIRTAAPETAAHEEANGNKIKVIAITIAILLTLLMLLTFLYIYKQRRKSIVNNETGSEENMELPILAVNNERGSEGNRELPIYDLVVIANATNNFSSDMKLGQGGFGAVYKGTLADGQEIAVKRLSQNSHQGIKEFKNEVQLCAKLQHRNLVKILGCCIQGEEKMLIYEYMPNKSLDSFIFGIERKLLDWSKRFHIICGIARGLMYLHQDSRLRVIHRDLKASNILLDSELNPKISDFGLARIFGGDQIEDNTNQVVGTYGYMAPEYAINGLFSIKTDVFSFGILLLEIVSGLKNRRPSLANQSVNLIGHAWKLWKEGIPLKLIDAHLDESCNVSEVLRCIHIGFLCLQHLPDNRPDMTSVVIMLNSEGVLPQPREPGFLLENIPAREECSPNNHTTTSNEISITLLAAR